jgi:hypothetical protein
VDLSPPARADRDHIADKILGRHNSMRHGPAPEATACASRRCLLIAMLAATLKYDIVRIDHVESAAEQG